MSVRSVVALKVWVCLLVAAMSASSTYAQSVHTITGDGADLQMFEDGATRWVGQTDHRVGRTNDSSEVKNSISLYVFQLPTLAPGDNISSAHLDFDSLGGSWRPPASNLNLYGLGYRSTTTLTVDDFFEGPFGSDTTDATPIQQDFGLTWDAGDIASGNGTYGTDTSGDQALANYLKAQYTAGAQGGDYVILRLNLETTQTSSNYFLVSSGNNTTVPPVLTIAINGATVSDPPVADAGDDQSVSDDDGDGFASVTLDGSGSTDPDGTIDSYEWTEGGSPIATGMNPTVSLSVGNHTLTLTVTDDTLMTDSDDVVVTVIDPNANTDPVADAGPDQSVHDEDEDGTASVTLDASASFDPDANGSIVSYEWTKLGSQIATGVNPTVNLGVGIHTITLTVTDDRGGTDSDNVAIEITSDLRPQLLNLGAASSPRFTVTDKTWPANHGEAEVCLWKDDAFATVSFTIDDNYVPDHQWWMDTLDLYGYKATWFVITYQVTANPGFSGPWSAFQTLHDKGHDVQSHTVTHLNFDRGFDPDDPAHDIYVEYGQSITDIETNVVGSKVMTLAYPGGTNTHYNDDAIAAQYYIAARGTAGTPNSANQINYGRTNSISGDFYAEDGQSWNNFSQTTLQPGHRNYRGWYCVHYHGVSSIHDKIISDLDYLTQKNTDIGIWVGTFTDIARYGQERDTAELNVTSVASDLITFTLNDDMHDGYFTFPLTIKVRVNNDWQDVAASQDGNPVEATLIENEGNKYALVQAVPDQGQVSLSPGAPSVITRAVFYNHSAFDAASDDDAIATDKQALRPGQNATFANYTSYAKGINGIIVDLPELPAAASASDFVFKVGNDNNTAAWATAPAPAAVITRTGEGVGGSDRVVLTFADGAIVGQWLEVTVLANANTGLESDDVFYFGNAVGDTGNSTTDAIVDATDEVACRNNPRNFMRPAAIDNLYDHNRDGKVDASDEIISRNNVTTMANDLELINP